MIKKVVLIFTVAIGLILSVAYVASGSPISASRSLQELPDRSAAVSGLSGRYRKLMAAEVDPCDVDFNHDGTVDVGDITRVANCWRSTDPTDIALYDLNGDGKITIVDIMLVVAQWGNHCPVLFAVDMSGLDTDPAMRDLAAEAGFHWVRRFISWGGIEPNEPVNGQHTYNWPDSLFDIYRNDRRLIPLVIVSAPNPSWAAVPDDPRRCGPIKDEHLDNGNFYDFVFNLVSRYADVTPYWGFYNEEDQWTDPPPECGHDAGGCWGGHGDEYAQMLAVAWDAAHSANPDAQVIFGSVAYEPEFDTTYHCWDEFFLRDAFQYMQGHPDDYYVDIIAANQYNFRRDDWDGGSGTLPGNQEIIAKFCQAVSDASFNANVSGAYSIDRWQTAYGLDKPMATGEVGLQVSSGCSSVPTCEELQARHAVHVNVRGMAAGLKVISWYTLVDKGGGQPNYGLLHGDLTPRPAYYAYPVLAQQLDGYEFDQQLVVSGKPNIQAYRFDQGGNKKLVLWRDDGQKIKKQSTTATETMSVSAAELGAGWTGRVRVTDKLGNVISTYGYPGAPSVALTFSSDPIYVEAY